MNTSEIIVTLAGFALSVFVVWFFFFSKKGTARKPSKDGRE